MNSLIVLLVFVGFCAKNIVNGHSENYPKHNYYARPCAQQQYTVRFRSLVCVPDGKNSFTPESQKNCEEFMYTECPEFNKCECLWLTFNISETSFLFPSCRLKYRAAHGGTTKFTWMEVYYTNQYGTTERKYPNGMAAILELHRHIKLHKVFNKDQPDFPKNVPDSNQAQGVKWDIVKPEESWRLLPTNISNISNPQNLCAKDDDKDCTETFANQFRKKFNMYGIGRYHGRGGVMKYTDIVACLDYVHDKLRRRVCRTAFVDTRKTSGLSQAVCLIHAYYDNASKKIEYREAEFGGNSFDPEGNLIR